MGLLQRILQLEKFKVDLKARSIMGANNIGLTAATTTNANDSIKITSANGSPLSTANPAYVTIESLTPGQLTIFKVVADVIILITGAHWGLGTFGDQVDYPLSVYALNDNGTLRWGIGAVPNHRLVLNADDSITPTDINLVSEILVNSALGADAQALEVGWFKANFDDTGGAAEDLWSVQTGDGDINLGKSPLLYKPYSLSIGAITTAPTKATTTLVDIAYWARDGENILWNYTYEHSNSVGSAAGSGDYLFPVPGGLLINTSKHYAINTADKLGGEIMGHGILCNSTLDELANFAQLAEATLYDSSNLRLAADNAGTQAYNVSSANGPLNQTIKAIIFSAKAKITGWI